MTEDEANAEARRCVRQAWENVDAYAAHYGQALRTLAPFATASAPSTATLTNYGALLGDTGEHAEAARVLRSALERSDATANTAYNLATALMNLQKQDEARALFRRFESMPEDRETIQAYFDPHGY